jgi:hypothetical protein
VYVVDDTEWNQTISSSEGMNDVFKAEMQRQLTTNLYFLHIKR